MTHPIMPTTRPVGPTTSQHQNASASIPPSPFPRRRRPRSASSKFNRRRHLVIPRFPPWSDESEVDLSSRCDTFVMSDLSPKGYHCIFVYIITSIYFKHLHNISSIRLPTLFFMSLVWFARFAFACRFVIPTYCPCWPGAKAHPCITRHTSIHS